MTRELARAVLALLAVAAISAALLAWAPECSTDAECAAMAGEAPSSPMEWARP